MRPKNHAVQFTRTNPPNLPNPSLPSAFPVDLGLIRRLVRKESNTYPKREECKDPQNIRGQQLSCSVKYRALEEIRVREENQFSQNLLGQAAFEAPRKVTLRKETFHNLISFCYIVSFIFSHSHLPSISFPGLPSSVY